MIKFPTPNFVRPYSDAPDILIGYYVYEWTDSRIPFYVGMGHSRRAWNEHLPHVEEIARQASSFRVRIYQHRLTKRIAHHVERELIKQRVYQGFKLVNKRIPNARS